MTVDDSAWHITMLFGRRAAVSHRDGHWSVVRECGCFAGESFDDALCRALRQSRRRPARGLSASRR